MARQIRKIRKFYPTYLIYVDGQNEQWYFQQLVRVEQLNISLRPRLSRSRSYKRIAKDLKSIIRTDSFDAVYWIVDFDRVIKEYNENPQNYDNFLSIYQELTSVGIKVLINVPCTEFWFLLHFEFTSVFLSDCKEVIRRMRDKHGFDYDKSQRFYFNPELYLRLKPLLGVALDNAKRLGEFDADSPWQAKAEMYKLFDDLGIIRS